MVKISDAINELKDTFRSIDVRIFCFKQDNVWKNVFTLVRFRRESVEELTSLQQNLIKKIGSLIETDEYKAGIFCFPVSRWDEMQKQFERKFICLTDTFAVNHFDQTFSPFRG